MIDFKKEIVLEDQRVKLEPISMDHLQGLYAAGERDENLLQYSFNRVHTEELIEEYLKQFMADRDKETHYAFSIFDKQSQEYAGVTTFLNVSNSHNRLEIGSTWIGKKFQRTGLNRHCKYLLLNYCFVSVGAERVELKTDSRNEQSKTAIQKIGAKFEGELRNHSVMPDGYRRNTSWDERNFVKKAVNWALRQIGKRSFYLNEMAIEVGEGIYEQDSKAAKWIASDALRELRSEKVQIRLRKKS